MAAKPVKIAFLADTKDFTSDMDKIGSSADSAATEVKSSTDKIDSALSTAADGSDKLASASAQTAGGLGDLGGALGLLPGPLGKLGAGMESTAPAIMGVTGAADLLNVATEKFPFLSKLATAATKVQAVAMRVLGVAFRFALGPVGLVIIGLTLLVGGLILAYKKSETFRKIVNGAFAAVKKVVSAVMPAIKKIVTTVFDGIKLYFTTLFKIYKAIFLTAWAAIKLVTKAAFTGIKELIVDPLNSVVDFVRDVPGKIRELGGKFLDAGKFIMTKLVDGIKNAAGFVGNIASGIWDAVKTLLNSGIDQINSALSFTIDLPFGKHITIDPPDIPHLASGGIVFGPTLALIGEAGPEAVVPLGQGFGNTYNYEITVQAGIGDPVAIGREVSRVVRAYEKSGGRR